MFAEGRPSLTVHLRMPPWVFQGTNRPLDIDCLESVAGGQGPRTRWNSAAFVRRRWSYVMFVRDAIIASDPLL